MQRVDDNLDELEKREGGPSDEGGEAAGEGSGEEEVGAPPHRLVHLVLAPFFNCPAQNEDFGLVERGPVGPQKGDLLAPRIRTCLTNPSTSDCLLTLFIIHFPKAIICIYKPNQKLDMVEDDEADKEAGRVVEEVTKVLLDLEETH